MLNGCSSTYLRQMFFSMSSLFVLVLMCKSFVFSHSFIKLCFSPLLYNLLFTLKDVEQNALLVVFSREDLTFVLMFE